MAAKGIWEGHRIEISVQLLPKYFFLASENCVKVDDQKVIKVGGFSLNHHGIATFNHQGEPTKIEINVKHGLFLPSYYVQISDLTIMQGYLGVETIGIIQIYFGSIGLALLSSLILLALPYYLDFVSQSYDLLLFVVDAVINAIFGAFFLYFAIALKSLLLSSLRLITTVLYIRIGFMLATTPSLIFNLIQEENAAINWWQVVGLRLVFIWLFGYLLTNCKRLSQELRFQ